MRRSLITAALLATTALTPVRAEAAPVVGWLVGALGVSATAAASLGINLGFAAGATFGGSVLGGFIVRTVVGIGLSLIAAKLAAPSTTSPPSERMVNNAQADAYAEWVYGETRKGGPMGYTNLASPYRWYVPILAAHQIEGVVEHWLGERVVTLTDESELEEIDWLASNVATAPIAGYGRIDPFLGAAGQTAHPGLVDAFAEITSSYDFKGLSGAVVWSKRAPESLMADIYPTYRRWVYAPVIQGSNTIYDPRDDSTGYTNNAALILADWIVNRLGRSVDWDEIADEADICDQVVTNAEAVEQPRWTINGTITDKEEFEDQRAQLCGACDAYFYERTDGKVGVVVGRWMEPAITLTAADFISLEISEGNSGAGAADEVTVIYTEPENAWRETPSGTWVENEVALPLRSEPQLFAIHNHNQAARVAKRIAKVGRAQYRLRGTIGLAGYEIMGGRDGGRGHRFVRVNFEEMGFDFPAEVGKLAREGPAMFSIELNSVASADFSFDAATEEPDRPVYENVVTDDSIPDVEGLEAATVDGGSVDFSWDEQDESLKQQVRLRVQGETNWQVHTAAEGESNLRVTGLIDAATYEYQARNMTTVTRVGDWAPTTPDTITVLFSSVPPADLASFAGGLASATSASLTIATANDPLQHAVEVWHSPTGLWGSAAKIGTEFIGPNETQIYLATGLSSGTNGFWAIPKNQSGVAGDTSGPVTVLVPDP